MVMISKDLREPVAMFYDTPVFVHSGDDQHRVASARAQTSSEFVSCTLQKCCQTCIMFTSSIQCGSSRHASDRAQSGKANSVAIVVASVAVFKGGSAQICFTFGSDQHTIRFMHISDQLQT